MARTIAYPRVSADKQATRVCPPMAARGGELVAQRPIDLGAVRDARKRLRQLALERPELTGPRGPRNRAGWEAVLEEDEMVAAKMAAFRLPEELIGRLDEYAEQMSSETGVKITRADVVKKLLMEGLDRVEAEQKKRKR
jgi:hypothetical protein